MSALRGGVEQSRERLVALVLLLQRAWRHGSLTQEQIVRELKIDEFPMSSKGPRKVLAYVGNEGAVRQKFERDKARIRELGFEIDTVQNDDGSVGYRIDPSSGYAPIIYFSPPEERVVKMALRFTGFGATGVFSVFNEIPASDGSLASSTYYTPVLRSLKLHRAIIFDYRSRVEKPRVVEPLLISVFGSSTYLVARVKGTAEIKGYRFSRMTSMPVVLPDVFEVDDGTLEIARGWRPEFSKSPAPIDIVVTTNENYADLITRQFPKALAATTKDGRVEVGLSFESPVAALRFVVDSADRVRLVAPKSLRSELQEWLKNVNRGQGVAFEELKFEGPATNDVLGQTLQLLHAVYLSEDGLRVSELATRFNLEPSHVRSIMDRLVSLQPMFEQSDSPGDFPAHVIKECDDWDDEANDDSTYRADFSDLGEGEVEPSPFMWKDLFELNVALREASRVYTDPAIFSAIEKIESATSSFVQVELSANEELLDDVREAAQLGQRIKIEYTPGVAEDSQTRAIEPAELKVLNGHTYVRAYCTTRDDWRTFRVDRIKAILAKSPADEARPVDPVSNWLTQVGEEGDEVAVVIESRLRWLFEPLPNAQWADTKDGRHAVKFRIADSAFLDHLMLSAGAGAVVITPKYTKAGHELAKRIAEQL